MPKLAKNIDCCGCAACFNACKMQAISMVANEAGFLYPKIITDKCVECHMCEKACPAIKCDDFFINYKPRAFIGQHRDDNVRKQSTSGGIFTAIAEVIIGKGGVVFGASMDEEFVVKHTFVETINDLSKFRNSKYVQSKIGDSFKKCEEFLKNDRWVCFSGTPCQIHGLKRFLVEDYNKLITVDIVCHSVPSPYIFEKYIELQKSKYPNINKLVFRDKSWGYSYSTMAIYENEKCLYRSGSESDLWFRSFLPGLCDRENCYNCRYQTWPRIADITIWDCFAVGKIDKDFDDNKGTTSIMTWTPKGTMIIKEFSNLAKTKEVSPDLFKNKILREKNKKVSVDREHLYKDASMMTPEEFFNKYRPVTFKVKFKHIAKRLLYITGLYSFVKNIMN